MLWEHERYYGLGMDALGTVCCGNQNVSMVRAWMLCLSDALGARTLLSPSAPPPRQRKAQKPCKTGYGNPPRLLKQLELSYLKDHYLQIVQTVVFSSLFKILLQFSAAIWLSFKACRVVVCTFLLSPCPRKELDFCLLFPGVWYFRVKVEGENAGWLPVLEVLPPFQASDHVGVH